MPSLEGVKRRNGSLKRRRGISLEISVFIVFINCDGRTVTGNSGNSERIRTIYRSPRRHREAEEGGFLTGEFVLNETAHCDEFD